jgi:type 1 glutamine amidotransferase
MPAVVIHCAMHTYRAAQIDDWREFLGVTSRRHEHQSRYPVKRVAAEHPILEGMPEQWVSPMDELYVIEKVWPGAQTLATAVSETNNREHTVMWTNQYGNARVFGTTFGHSDDTFRDPVFLTIVSRGLLWAAGRL